MHKLISERRITLTIDDRIANLRQYVAYVGDLYTGEDDREGSDELIEVVESYIAELQRQADHCQGSEADLVGYKRTIRAAIRLQQGLTEQHWDMLKGWWQQDPPTNSAQQMYALLSSIILSLSVSVWRIEQAIEEQHPGSIAQFDEERRQFAHSLTAIQ